MTESTNWPETCCSAVDRNLGSSHDYFVHSQLAPQLHSSIKCRKNVPKKSTNTKIRHSNIFFSKGMLLCQNNCHDMYDANGVHSEHIEHCSEKKQVYGCSQFWHVEFGMECSLQMFRWQLIQASCDFLSLCRGHM